MPRFDDPDTPESQLVAALVGALPDPVVVADRGGTVIAFNEAARQVWPALARGRPPLSIAVRSPDVLEGVERLLRGESRASAQYAERVPVERLYDVSLAAIDAGGRTDRGRCCFCMSATEPSSSGST